MTESLATPRSIFRLLKAAASDWREDNALRLSAALAYYSIFSIAPLIVIAMALAGWLLGEEATKGVLESQLSGLLGPQAAQGIQAMVQSASRPEGFTMAGAMGLLALLVGASGVFGQLKDALNTIWEVKPKSGQGVIKLVRERLLSFGMVAVIGFLLLVSLMMTTFLSGMMEHLGSVLPMSDALTMAAGSAISFGVITLSFAAIFKVLPDVNVRWSDVWVGALVTALLFEIGKFFLGVYLGRESTTSAFGAAGSLVLVLLWVYYASLILLFGAEFTQVYAKARGHQIEPSKNAEAVTLEARAQQGLPPGFRSPEGAIPKKEDPLMAPMGTMEGLSATPSQKEGPVGRALEKNAISTVFAALGSGFATGILLRKIERPAAILSPAQQVRQGSKAMLADAAIWLGKVFSRARHTLSFVARH